jgi:outer membrane lipoprotein-sorting protein
MNLALIWLIGSSLAADPTVEELLNATDDVLRGESSKANVEMHVKTSRYERTMKMETWSQGTEKSLIVILSPAKDAGVATLKVGDNIWNYLPKVDRTMKVPAGMMGGSWMGSHFTNDDLVKESRLSEDFSWTEPAKNAAGNWLLVLTPNSDAAIVWGSLEVEVTPDKMPVSIRYKDEDGELARTMTWEDIQDVQGRKIPMVMKLIPANKPDEFTKISYSEMTFDIDVPESTFSLQSLKN